MEHSDLVSEMMQVEHLSTQDRLQLARVRRAQQLKTAKQKDKEWLKAQRSRERMGGSNNHTSTKRHITFEDSVVLLEAAARNDITEVARLLQKGVTPDATNMDGLTALHQCCIDDNAEMLKLLLDYGANVNAQDSERWTPLHAAATCGHLNLVKILIARGANLLAVNADGNMPYDICDDEEALDYIEAEMSKRGVTQELIDETRAATETLMLTDLQEIAIQNGDVEVPDPNGATPLHIASANGYIRVVEFLLEQHVSTDVVDNDLWTPVHAAACWGHLEVLEMLAQAGADLYAKNKNEETPSDICEDPEIRERIEQLKSEQESKRLAEAQRKRVRRSQSNNTRAQSVRRTSLRDKTLTTKKDAVEEARFRLQAQEGYTTPDTNPNPMSGVGSENVNNNNNQASVRSSSINNGSNLKSNTNANNNLNSVNNNLNVNSNTTTNSNNNNTRYPNVNNNNNNNVNNNNVKNNNSLYGGIINNNNHHNNNSSSQPPSFDFSRRSPDGKDNDSYVGESNKKLLALSSLNGGLVNNQQSSNIPTTEVYSTSNNENGKINVQVTVLVEDQSNTGTLADLKKHRSQTRSSVSPENGSITTTTTERSSITNGPVELSLVSSTGKESGVSYIGNGSMSSVELLDNSASQQMPKFTGNTSDVVSDSTRSRRCCIIM